jgi:hypothetical protein
MKSEKTVFRIRKTSNYVSISRFTLEDKRLSWEARGLHAFLLAKPDDWKTCIAHLIKCSPAGRDKTRRIINELIAHNYIVKSEQRSLQGRFSSPQYIVYETPHDGFLDQSNRRIQPETENPSTVNPSPGKPSPSDPPLLSIQTQQSKQITNKTTTKEKYFWSEKLSAKHKESIFSLLHEIEQKPAQLLLDELTGQINNIKNPVAYFRTLLQSYLAGDFIPAKALQVEAEREARIRNERAIAQSQKIAEEKLQQQMNKILGEHSHE